MKLTFGSLFAGIGGLDLGFENAGMECKWQVEINPFARRVLTKHWPEVFKHDDITTFDAPEWVDCIAGGFPCQDISYAGKGAGLAGERSGLFFEAMRVVREVGPRIVVLENVAALLTRGMDQVLGTLASLGYDAEWHCIPAASIGAPHIRDRIFILAYSDQPIPSQEWLQRSRQQLRTCSDSKEDEARILPDTDSTRLSWRNEPRSTGATAARIITRSELERAFTENRRGQWSIEPDVDRMADGIPSRVDRIRGLGNAVVPQVAEVIAKHVINKHQADRRADGD